MQHIKMSEGPWIQRPPARSAWSACRPPGPRRQRDKAAPPSTTELEIAINVRGESNALEARLGVMPIELQSITPESDADDSIHLSW